MYAFYLILISSLELTVAIKVNHIIGGSPASIEECPFIVSILNYGSHHCGGTLISPRWVITAAHCLSSGPFRRPVEYYGIVAGQDKLSDSARNEINTNKVTEVFIHPKYNRLRHDIALMKLKKPYTFNKKIRAASLFTSSSEYRQKHPEVATVLGWGSRIPRPIPMKLEQRSAMRMSSFKQLRKVSVPILPTAKCMEFLASQHAKFNSSSVLCSGGIENEDACQGDSGGPLMFKDYLIGIVSWGVGCGVDGYPGVYTRVDYFWPWINDTLDGRNIPSVVAQKLDSDFDSNGTSRIPLWSLQILIFQISLMFFFIDF